MTAPQPTRIALLAYPGCMGSEIFGVVDLLLVAQHVARAFAPQRPDAFEIHVISVQGRSIRTASGPVVEAKAPRGRFDWLLVPGLEVVQGTEWPSKLARLQPELDFVRKSFLRGTRVGSVCVGSFLLGAAGLLDDRQVTTAWIMAKELAARHPKARVNAHALVVEDGAVLTSGAITASFDVALHLVKQIFGAEVASATARIALLPKARTSQAPFVDARLIAPQPQATQSFSSSVAQWLEQRLQEPFSLARLASAFHVSPRTMMRRTLKETGHTPLTLLQRARVERAKQLLQTTAWSIAKVVEAVGYNDVATFSRLFAREVGETPARFRFAARGG
jgi:transcriptional regulator GlxA family with amidase domain